MGIITTSIETDAPSTTHSGKRGTLRLSFGVRGGMTVLTERMMSAPFGTVRLTRMCDGIPEAQITNPAGGVLGGDELEITVMVESGALVSLLTQGATKLYRGRESSQHADFRVEDGAFLEYLPHHTIPYADSSFKGRTIFDLAPSATLVAWEILCAGRLSRGERFAFERISSLTKLFSDGNPLATDGLSLSPDNLEPFGGASYCATLFVHAPENLSDLASELRSFLAGSNVFAASASAPVTNLCVVRILANGCPGMYRTLNGCRGTIRDSLELPAPGREVS